MSKVVCLVLKEEKKIEMVTKHDLHLEKIISLSQIKTKQIRVELNCFLVLYQSSLESIGFLAHIVLLHCLASNICHTET